MKLASASIGKKQAGVSAATTKKDALYFYDFTCSYWL